MTSPFEESIDSKSSGSPDPLTLAAFAGFVVLGGGTAVAIRISFGELAPFWGGAARFFLAALVFWGLALLRGIPAPRGRALTGALLYGALAFGAGIILIYWGLTATSASLSQILLATVPLLTLLFAAIHRLETFHLRGLFGSLIAVAGIGIVVGGSAGQGVSLPHVLAIIGAAVCYAEAGVVAKLFPLTDPIATNAVGMTLGAVMLAAASLVSKEPRTIPSQASTWIAFLYLVVFVSVVAFFLYLFALGRWTATGISYGFVLIPLVTVIIAARLAGELVTPKFAIGAALVLLGVTLGSLLPPGKARRNLTRRKP